MSKTDTETEIDIELAESQVWETEPGDDEVIINPERLTIDELFEGDDGNEKVRFTEHANGVYGDRQKTADRVMLERGLDDCYMLVEAVDE